MNLCIRFFKSKEMNNLECLYRRFGQFDLIQTPLVPTHGAFIDNIDYITTGGHAKCNDKRREDKS